MCEVWHVGGDGLYVWDHTFSAVHCDQSALMLPAARFAVKNSRSAFFTNVWQRHILITTITVDFLVGGEVFLIQL